MNEQRKLDNKIGQEVKENNEIKKNTAKNMEI